MAGGRRPASYVAGTRHNAGVDRANTNNATASLMGMGVGMGLPSAVNSSNASSSGLMNDINTGLNANVNNNTSPSLPPWIPSIWQPSPSPENKPYSSAQAQPPHFQLQQNSSTTTSSPSPSSMPMTSLPMQQQPQPQLQQQGLNLDVSQNPVQQISLPLPPSSSSFQSDATGMLVAALESAVQNAVFRAIGTSAAAFSQNSTANHQCPSDTHSPNTGLSATANGTSNPANSSDEVDFDEDAGGNENMNSNNSHQRQQSLIFLEREKEIERERERLKDHERKLEREREREREKDAEREREREREKRERERERESDREKEIERERQRDVERERERERDSRRQHEMKEMLERLNRFETNERREMKQLRKRVEELENGRQKDVKEMTGKLNKLRDDNMNIALICDETRQEIVAVMQLNVEQRLVELEQSFNQIDQNNRRSSSCPSRDSSKSLDDNGAVGAKDDSYLVQNDEADDFRNEIHALHEQLSSMRGRMKKIENQMTQTLNQLNETIALNDGLRTVVKDVQQQVNLSHNLEGFHTKDQQHSQQPQQQLKRKKTVKKKKKISSVSSSPNPKQNGETTNNSSNSVENDDLDSVNVSDVTNEDVVTDGINANGNSSSRSAVDIEALEVQVKALKKLVETNLRNQISAEGIVKEHVSLITKHVCMAMRQYTSRRISENNALIDQALRARIPEYAKHKDQFVLVRESHPNGTESVDIHNTSPSSPVPQPILGSNNANDDDITCLTPSASTPSLTTSSTSILMNPTLDQKE